MFSTNCVRNETIKDSPYHVVFGMNSPAGIFPGAKINCLHEKDIEKSHL